MDRFDVHAECCTVGGDKTYGHHTVRSDLYAQAKRGLGSAVLEAKGVLDVLQCEQGGAGSGRGRERPADVLLAQALCALKRLVICPKLQGNNWGQRRDMLDTNVDIIVWSDAVERMGWFFNQ